MNDKNAESLHEEVIVYCESQDYSFQLLEIKKLDAQNCPEMITHENLISYLSYSRR